MPKQVQEQEGKMIVELCRHLLQQSGKDERDISTLLAKGSSGTQARQQLLLHSLSEYAAKIRPGDDPQVWIDSLKLHSIESSKVLFQGELNTQRSRWLEAETKLNKQLHQATQDLQAREAIVQSAAQLMQDMRALEVRLHNMHHTAAWRLGTRLCAKIRGLRQSALGRAAAWSNAALKLRLKQYLKVQKQISLVKHSGLFNEQYYLATYPLIGHSTLTPLEHYILHGEREGRQPNPIFRPYHYQNQLGDGANKIGSPLVHYVKNGQRMDIDPSPDFSNRLYRIKHSLNNENPLAHYLGVVAENSVVLDGGELAVGQNQASQINRLQDEIESLMKEVESKSVEDKLLDIRFKILEKPRVSILIPFYNELEHTVNCLYSLCKQGCQDFEVILIDDASSKEDCSVLQDIEGVTLLHNRNNLGYLQSCNRASEAARGTFIVQLNNDTLALDGWLENLLSTFELFPNAGLVGSMMLSDSGLIQEAGGIIFADASGYNYGRGINPHESRYNYSREVDYCSGASIMIVKDIWDRVGGYDPLFAPAYYEDTDLAMQVKQLGFQVIFNPLSKIIHHEGVSSGTSLDAGVKRYQVVNQQKFLKKWQAQLKSKPIKPAPENLDRYVREQQAAKWLLWIDSTTPTPDKDSGSIDTVNFLRQALQEGWGVTFMPWDEVRHDGAYTSALQAHGVECVVGPTGNPHACLSELTTNYDVVVVSRLTIAQYALPAVRQRYPNAHIVFNTVDLHFLRYQREAELLKKFPNMKIQRRDLAAEKQAELDLVRQSDVTIVVSDAERNVLTENVPDAQIVTIPLYRQVVGAGNTYSQRANIGFIGGYQHPPNIDAVMHFAKKVWPKLCKQLGNCKFIIAGSDMPQEILQLAGEHIEVRGYIEDLSDFFEELRIMVAPLRYGAGIKGKIVSGLCHGVPQVVSRVAAEGMGLSHGQEVLIAADDQQYADLIMQLYNDSALWAQMSEQAIAKAHAAYSSAAVAGRVSELLTQLLADRPRSEGVNP